MNNYTLGIDTSNYKTSIALVDEDDKLVYSRSEFLDVKKGSLGLRQQTAFFMHNSKLPIFIDEAIKYSNYKIGKIGVSKIPRNMPDSYMPVFMAGYNIARVLSSALNIPIYEYSHQEGHIEASVHNYIDSISFPSAIMHLSGGTSEVLKFSLYKNEENILHYDTKIIGGSKDISIGQLFDRIGVNLNFNFPSGKYLDEYALNHINILEDVDIRKEKLSYIKLNDGFFNLSGLETQMKKTLDIKNIPLLFYLITDLLYRISEEIYNKIGIRQIYMCGGVSESNFIRYMMRQMIEIDNSPFKVIFPEKGLSGDNAIGVAWLANKNK